MEPIEIADYGVDPTNPERPLLVLTGKDGAQHHFAFSSFHSYHQFRMLAMNVGHVMVKKLEEPKIRERQRAMAEARKRR